MALAKVGYERIQEMTDATGMIENTTAAKTGGNIAKKARIELEQKTKKKVISSENYLPTQKVISNDPVDNE